MSDNSNNIRVYRTAHVVSPLKEVAICPYTQRKLFITYDDFDVILKNYSKFVKHVVDNFNSGEPSCTSILKKSIVAFLAECPELYNSQYSYMFSMYVLSLCRCDVGYPENMPQVFFALAKQGFMSKESYKNSPPYFIRFIERISNPNNFLDMDRAVFCHNCFIITNRMDRFTFQSFPDNGEDFPLPAINTEWLYYWVVHVIHALIIHGELISPDVQYEYELNSVITVDDQTQRLLDEIKNKEN